MVASTFRTIFAQPSEVKVREQLDTVAEILAGEFPAVADLLAADKPDLTAFADFPLQHWQKIWSTNPSSASTGIKRRTDVVGIFPNPGSLLRLAACVLIEAHDEWQDNDRRYLCRRQHGPAHPPPPTELPERTRPPTKTPRRRTAATA